MTTDHKDNNMKLFDVYPLYDVTPIKGEGVYVWDEKGTQYLDLYGGHGVISIGHAHPHYVESVNKQLASLGFYSNAVKNPLQEQLAQKLGKLSGCTDYQLFLCNSGAEANENALKLASFTTGRSKVIAFKNSFHGRTSAAVAVTDNQKIQAPINNNLEVSFLELNDAESLKNELSKGDVCAVIIEGIQGVGGLDEASTEFFKTLQSECRVNGTLLILDEIQSGFGRTGDFFAFQKHGITPDIITMAKGMGNGFPIGGVLIHNMHAPWHGMLGTTFGGNHLACVASAAVLDAIEEEGLLQHAAEVSQHFIKEAKTLPQLKKIKGRGLMLGLEFDFEVGDLRKQLIYEHHMFTGGSNNKNLLRILPPLSVTKEQINQFFNALKQCLITVPS